MIPNFEIYCTSIDDVSVLLENDIFVQFKLLQGLCKYKSDNSFQFVKCHSRGSNSTTFPWPLSRTSMRSMR